MGEKKVEIKDLCYKEGTKYLLKNINWEVKTGEQWVVFGMNGCGKTTLLSVLSGYRKYTKGTIKLFSQELNRSNAVFLRQRIGFVSSSYFDNIFMYENAINIVLSGLFGSLSERDNVKDNDVKKAVQLLRALGLREKAAYPYDMLSKGQRQKVLIARALMMQPELLVLDEPCTGLDILAREYFLNTVQQIIEETNVNVIYVTHHVDEILPVFNKAMLMKNGSVHSQGDMKQVFCNETLSKFFDYKTEVIWEKDKLRFNISDDLKIAKSIWNMNNI